MDLAEALLEVGTGQAEASFSLFAETLDQRWIAEALAATGAASVRRRKLPAEYVVWLVIGMGLLRDRSIEEVVRHLHLVLPAGDPGPPERHGRRDRPSAGSPRRPPPRNPVRHDGRPVGHRRRQRASLARPGGLRRRWLSAARPGQPRERRDLRTPQEWTRPSRVPAGAHRG